MSHSFFKITAAVQPCANCFAYNCYSIMGKSGETLPLSLATPTYYCYRAQYFGIASGFVLCAAEQRSG